MGNFGMLFSAALNVLAVVLIWPAIHFMECHPNRSQDEGWEKDRVTGRLGLAMILLLLSGLACIGAVFGIDCTTFNP